MGLFGTMTLGELIDALERRPKDQSIYFDFCSVVPGKLMSYRGFYDHLAIDPLGSEHELTVAAFLERLRAAIGETYEGYKGGSYRMSRESPIWVAEYGSSGSTAVLGVHDDCEYSTVIKTGWVPV